MTVLPPRGFSSATGNPAALPETVGGAGVVLGEKDPALVAEAVHRTQTDASLRAAIVEAGRARVEHFSLEQSGKMRIETINAVVEAGCARA